MKKFIATIACFFLVFAFAGSALAAYPLNFNGTATTTFISTSSMTKPSSNTWTYYYVRLSSMSFTGTSFSYAYARPQGTDGTLYATKNKVNMANSRRYTPNSSGATSDTIRVKVYNTDYEENNVTNNTMTAAGQMTGTLS
jgi:hypothetical protein